MRRILSLMLIFCILHTSNYAALVELASAVGSTASASNPSGAAVLEPASTVELPAVSDNNRDATTVTMPSETPATAPYVPSKTRDKHSLAYLKTVATLTVVLSLCAGAGTWWSLQPPKVAPTDVCMRYEIRDHTAHLQQRQYHASKGDLPLEEGIQGWLNENAAVMGELGDVVRDWQHGDFEKVRDAWSKTKSDVHNIVHNHGINTLGDTSIACDIVLWDGNTPDRAVDCRRDRLSRSKKSKPFKEGVDAQLWLHPSKNQYILLKNIGLEVTPFPESRLYPSSTQSLGIEAKHDSRRMLLQSGNTLHLPQAIEATLNNRNDVKQLLAKVADNLRQWNPSTAEITELNALIKGIFEAHGFAMTGDVQCTFASENGDLKLSGCALMSTRRAARSFAVQEASEKVTFKQSANNPVKFDAVDVETDVLPPKAALPLVLQRAADPLHGELEILHNDQCRPDDRSQADAVAATVHAALRIPNVAMPEDLACDVTVRDGAVHTVACHPAEAPESAVCGTYNGTFAANGRVWIKPNGALVISANRNWDTTATAELPRTPTVQLPETPSVSRPHSVTLPHTLTPQQTASESLPVVERPIAPANTTTRLYWANWATKPADSSVWVAEVNHTSGGLINPRLFVQGEPVSQPGGLHVDEKNGFIYWGLNSGRGIFAARLQTSPPRVYDNVTLLSTLDTQEVDSMYLEGDTLYWLRGAQLIWGTVDPANPISITNVRRPIDNITTLGPNDLCPLSSPAGLYVNKDQKQLILSCQGGSKGPLMFKFDVDGRTITQRKAMSNAMPEMPQSSAISPELGRVFTRSPGKLYGADIDLDIPAVSGFEPLVTNTTMVKYYGGMSVVPNATEWMGVSSAKRVYWSDPRNSQIKVADFHPLTREALNSRLFLGGIASDAFFVDELGSSILWINRNGGDLCSGFTKSTQVTNYTCVNRLDQQVFDLNNQSYGPMTNLNYISKNNIILINFWSAVCYGTFQILSERIEELKCSTMPTDYTPRYASFFDTKSLQLFWIYQHNLIASYLDLKFSNFTSPLKEVILESANERDYFWVNSKSNEIFIKTSSYIYALTFNPANKNIVRNYTYLNEVSAAGGLFIANEL